MPSFIEHKQHILLIFIHWPQGFYQPDFAEKEKKLFLKRQKWPFLDLRVVEIV